MPRVAVLVCRGCCCGNPANRPDIDHGSQLDRLRAFADRHPTTVRVQTTECLGPCENANVVVVRPTPAGRRAGGRPVWLGLVDDHAITLVERWVEAGGPGVVAPPGPLELQVIAPGKPSEAAVTALGG